MTARGRALVALAAGGVLVAAVLVAVLLESRPRLAETNNVRDPIFAAVVPGGATLCQTGELIPASAARLQVLIGTYGTPLPPLRATITVPGPPPVVANVRGGGGQGYIRIPIPTARHSHAGARVCLRNGGPTKIALGGEAIPNHATIDGRDAGGRIRLAWYRPGSESWVSLTPAVAHRFGYGKAPWQGSWTLWLAALALVAALGAAGVAVVRSVPR